MADPEIYQLAETVLETAEKTGIMIAAAESCTGGLVAAALTEVPGSSTVFERGFVTYSNDAKSELVGVPAELIDRHGAVSGQVAGAMAEGALARSKAQIAIAVTGVAGPGGGTLLKPVGLVWFGLAKTGQDTLAWQKVFADNGRSFIRRETVLEALRTLQQTLTTN